MMVLSVDLEAARHETEKLMNLLGAHTTQNSRLALAVSDLTDKVTLARQQLRIQSEAWRPLASALKCRTDQNLKNVSAMRQLQQCQERIKRHTSEIESCEATAVQRKLELASQLENSRATVAEREASYKRAKVDKEASLSSLSLQCAEKKAGLVQLTDGVRHLRATVAALKREKQMLLKSHAKKVGILRTRCDGKTKELESKHAQSPRIIQKLEREIEALELKKNLFSGRKDHLLSRLNNATKPTGCAPPPRCMSQSHKKSIYELLSLAINETVSHEGPAS